MSTDVSNARDPEQIRRMNILREKGLCYFCRQGSEEDKTLPKVWLEGRRWYLMENDFPLEGSVHHYLLIPKRHISLTHELTDMERREQANLELTLQTMLCVTGYSMFVRSGDTRFTGATLTHLHYHFLVGGVKPNDGPTDLSTVIPVVLAFKQKK